MYSTLVNHIKHLCTCIHENADAISLPSEKKFSDVLFQISKNQKERNAEKKSNLQAGLQLNFHTDIGFSEAENSKLGKLPLEPSN